MTTTIKIENFKIKESMKQIAEMAATLTSAEDLKKLVNDVSSACADFLDNSIGAERELDPIVMVHDIFHQLYLFSVINNNWSDKEIDEVKRTIDALNRLIAETIGGSISILCRDDEDLVVSMMTDLKNAFVPILAYLQGIKEPYSGIFDHVLTRFFFIISVSQSYERLDYARDRMRYRI